MTRTALFFATFLFCFGILLTACSDELSDTDEVIGAPISQQRGLSNGNQGPPNQGGQQGNQGQSNTQGQQNNGGQESNDNSGTTTTTTDCTNGNELNTDRAACTTTLSYSPSVSLSVSGTTRTIMANNIPDHRVGVAGPNNISPQNNS